MTMKPHWPDDADGDVLRRLAEGGFDFDVEHNIEFNVDFGQWPPSPSFIDRLRATYPASRLIDPENGYEGYVTFGIRGRLSYELVTFVQRSISELAEPFDGVCESWGVLH